jgi:threonine 3-dehydrogenase
MEGVGLTIGEVDDPRPGRGEVLVKVERAAICGTDIHIWEWNDWARSRIKRLPLIVGHEFSGMVVEKGEGVRGVDVGDPVSGETHIVDGSCYQCRTGRMHICRNLEIIGVDRPGAFAEYIVIPSMNAWVNDRDLEMEVAAILEPLGNAVHAVYPDDVGDLAGKYGVVMGCGPIGLMSIAVLREAGLEKIFAVEISDYRLRFAERMGADVLINPLEEDVVEAILGETGGRGVDIVLEMSGSEKALRSGLRVATPGGRVSLLGLPDKDVTLDINNLIIFKGVHIYGITGRRMFETWYQVRGLLNIPGFRDRMKSLITHRFKMRDIEEGIRLLKTKEAVKIVLEPKF